MSHRIAIAGSEIAFDCAEDQSVLDAALRAGIEMPYSCRKGVCGNCAGGIAQGEVAGLAGASTRNESCTPEQVLYCMCTPATDLQIEPVSWHRVDPGARKTFTAKVFRNQLAAPDVSRAAAAPGGRAARQVPRRAVPAGRGWPTAADAATRWPTRRTRATR